MARPTMKKEGITTSYPLPLLSHSERYRYTFVHALHKPSKSPTDFSPDYKAAPRATKFKIAMSRKELLSVVLGFIFVLMVVLAYYMFPQYLDQRSRHTPPPFNKTR